MLDTTAAAVGAAVKGVVAAAIEGVVVGEVDIAVVRKSIAGTGSTGTIFGDKGETRDDLLAGASGLSPSAF